ncbi:MAG: hypothetical protein HY708_08320 [Ignavibacteriae bacterium]|nr:hypothetical protein [Ignavibacteriota bacterium]
MMCQRSGREFVLWMSLAIGFVPFAPSFAQEKREPPRREVRVPLDTVGRESEKQLPRIDLPEFLITGEETSTLPEFTKSPIEGEKAFDPLSRKPEPGVRESTRVELGGSTKAHVDFMRGPKGFSGNASAGYGSYRSPFFDGWFGTNSKAFDFLLKAAYRSSEGYSANTDYRKGQSGLSAGAYLPNGIGVLSGARVHGNFGFDGETYRLYGSANPERKRSVNRFTGALSLNSDATGSFGFTVGAHASAVAVSDSIRTGENEVGVEATLRKSFGSVELKAEGGLWRNFYDAPSILEDPFFTHAGLFAQVRIADKADIIGGGEFFFTRGSDTKSVGKLHPRLVVVVYPARWLTLSARYEPFIRHSSVSTIVKESPYVVNDIRIRHTEFYNNFTFGVETEFARTFKSKASVTYSRSRDYPIYVQSSAVGTWSVEYFGTTRILAFQGEIYADITSSDYLGAVLTVRESKNSATNRALPYFPSITLSGLYQHRFSFGLTLGAKARWLDNQYVDLANTRKLGSFVLLDATAEYAIISTLKVIVTMENSLNHRQMLWDNYITFPRTFSLGLSFSW